MKNKLFIIVVGVLLFLYMSPMLLGALVALFVGIIALSWNILWFLVILIIIYSYIKGVK